MKSKRIAILFFAGMVLLGSAYGALANNTRCDVKSAIGDKWLATGAVTRIDNSTIYFLGKDNRVYMISTQDTEVFAANNQPMGPADIRVGEKIRVYGTSTGPCSIRADRIRLFRSPASPSLPEGARGPEKEVKIVIEKEPVTYQEQAEPLPVPDWQTQGLITDISYTGRRVTIMTSGGSFTINAATALIANGASRIAFGQLNIGDKVDICGNIIGVNEVAAQRIDVLRTRFNAENAVPTLPVSIVGVILSIDYSSFTFRMASGASGLVVSIDNKTVIQHQKDLMPFIDLRPGMRIKMSGYGSLITGYAANHIQVISVAP